MEPTPQTTTYNMDPVTHDEPVGWVWLALAAGLWFFISTLKLQIARIVPFDALAGVILGWILFKRVMPFAGRRARRRWKLEGPPIWYLGFGALISGGLASGLNTTDLALWAVELLTMLYLLLMLVSADLFTTRRPGRFLEVGGWTFAALCAVCGLVAGLYLVGGPQMTLFYEMTPVGPGQKFTGPMRFPNQWAGFFLSMFPLLLALSFQQRPSWQRTLLLGAMILGFITIPATGSRSGMFLIVAQAGGFALLYMLMSRSGHVLTRLLYLGTFAAVMGGAYWLLNKEAGDNHIVVRSLGAFDMVFEQRQVADSWRDYNWKMAIGEFERHPLIGMGLGTFERFYDRHEVHSSYLSFAAETGLAGLLPYLLLMLLPLQRVLRALAAFAARGQADVLLIALLLSMISQMLFAIHHNNTRNRHVWLILLMAMLYSEVAVVGLRARLQARRQAGGQPPDPPAGGPTAPRLPRRPRAPMNPLRRRAS